MKEAETKQNLNSLGVQGFQEGGHQSPRPLRTQPAWCCIWAGKICPMSTGAQVPDVLISTWLVWGSRDGNIKLLDREG